MAAPCARAGGGGLEEEEEGWRWLEEERQRCNRWGEEEESQGICSESQGISSEYISPSCSEYISTYALNYLMLSASCCKNYVKQKYFIDSTALQIHGLHHSLHKLKLDEKKWITKL